MTDDILASRFTLSAGLKARFQRAENKGTTQVQANMHRVGVTPQVTAKVLDDGLPPAPQYYLIVGDDLARAYYPFEQTGFSVQNPSRAYDAVTAGNYGIYHETVTHIDGPIAVQAPATDRAIRTVLNDSAVLPSPIDPGPGSWEMWVRTSETVGAPTVVGYIIGVDPAVSFKMTLNTNGTTTFGVYDDTDALQYQDSHPDVINDGQWHHVVAVDTGSAVVVYVDGSAT